MRKFCQAKAGRDGRGFPAHTKRKAAAPDRRHRVMEESNGQTTDRYAADGYEAMYRADWYGPGGMMEPGRPGPVDRGQQLKEARRHFSKLGIMFLVGTLVIYAVQLPSIWLGIS